MMYNEEAFNRMIEGTKMLMEQMGLQVHECKSHISKMLKVEADPTTPEHVWVYVPEAIFEGSKTNEQCAEWTVEQWAAGMEQLAKLFSVKGHATSRMMIPAPAAMSRTYANYYWVRDESVKEDMKSWNIVVDNPSPTESAESDATAASTDSADPDGKDESAYKEAHAKRVKELEDYQRQRFFMFM